MPNTRPSPAPYRASSKQRGVAAVEFAFVAMIFFMLFFGIIEVARALYVCNTLQEVTRRAAALAVNTDFSDAAALKQVRYRAVFREAAGTLAFGDPISDQNVKIDYLQIPANATVPVAITGALPASPQENRVNCTRNPGAANCIRLVRVRICTSGSDGSTCTAVPYKPLLTLVPFVFPLPVSTTIANVETLGMPPGTPCGC
jgi:Flp pilus assembly protein TadG